MYADLLQTALQHHRAGRLARAEEIYLRLLELDPENAEALHLFGVLALDSGRPEQAAELIDKSISLKPTQGDFHFDLGHVHRARGDYSRAQACFEEAIRLDPGAVNAHINLGLVHLEQSCPQQAESCYRTALQLQPNSAIAWNNLGNLFLLHSNLGEAATCFQNAIRSAPDYAEAHNGLGSVEQKRGDLAKARACFEQALACNAQYATAHYNLGVVLQTQNALDQAQACFRRALSLRPHFVEAYYQWASVLKECQRYAEAEACLETALRLRPEFIPALGMLASVLEFQGKTSEARHVLAKALAVGPSDDLEIRTALFLPVIYESETHIQEERVRLERGLAKLKGESLALAEPEKLTGGLPFFLAYQGENDRDFARKLAAIFAKATPSLHFVADHCQPGASVAISRPRIRVGFVSRFFYRHTIGKLNAGMIRNLSRQKFEVIVYRFPGLADGTARAIDASADRAITLPPDLVAARQLVAAHCLDVLFYTDIGMDPLTYFLAFARLAPVQCVTWGHPVTTGIPTVDYFLSCNQMEPPDAQEHYTEQLVKFPHINICYDEPQLPAPVKTRADFGLPVNVHLYVCSQSLYKLHPAMDAVLRSILQQDPSGLIVLLAGSQPHWKELLSARLSRAIPETVRRIHFLPALSQDDFLHLQALADVLLDTFPFGGGNTSLEAFAFGTPVVTLAHHLMRGRITLACYQQMGLLDCVAADPEDYVRKAIHLGTDPAWRQEVRKQILERKHLLYDNTQAVTELEAFLQWSVSRSSETAERSMSDRPAWKYNHE